MVCKALGVVLLLVAGALVLWAWRFGMVTEAVGETDTQRLYRRGLSELGRQVAAGAGVLATAGAIVLTVSRWPRLRTGGRKRRPSAPAQTTGHGAAAAKLRRLSAGLPGAQGFEQPMVYETVQRDACEPVQQDLRDLAAAWEQVRASRRAPSDAGDTAATVGAPRRTR